MELKLRNEATSNVVCLLLIVPYGIEIFLCRLPVPSGVDLLIVPYGIEISDCHLRFAEFARF